MSAEHTGSDRSASGDHASAREFLPPRLSLTAIRSAAGECRGCPLWQNATQTVFGEGLRKARLMLVGEMPGDREDLAGRPFVGPAGRVLDDALEAAKIGRRDAYVTNVVKHFKWELRGKRRLHKRPSTAEVRACMPWLEAEITVVKPSVLVCLGATAAQALLGRGFLVSKQRGRPIESPWGVQLFATVHPSSLLRNRDRASRAQEMQRFIDDLATARAAMEGEPT